MAETNYSRGRNSANLEYSQEMDENTMIIIGVIAALIVIILLIYFLGYVPRTERYFLRVWKQFLRRNESSTGDSREHITKVVGEATSCELRSNPCYILKYFGYPIKKAIGSAATIGFIIALCGAIGFWYSGLVLNANLPLSIGFINLPAFLIFIPITMFMAKIGANSAHKIEKSKLQMFFGIFLYVIGTIFIFRYSSL